MTETVRVTSELLWRATVIAVLIDVPLLLAVGKWVPLDLFRRLKWLLAGTAAVVYALLWGVFASLYFWDSVYHAVFPAWSRWALPWFYGLLFGALALLFWRIAAALPRWPAVWFALCGGMVSLVGHGVGVSRGLMKVPMLADASVASALTFGVFEFIFYWSVIVAIAAAAYSVAKHRSRPDDAFASAGR